MGNVACYCRVSTGEQSIERQLEATRDYAVDVLSVELPDLKIYRDKSTGTNTQRSGYKDMMADAETGQFQAVVVHSVDRICRSIGDLERTASRLREVGVELHIVSEGLVISAEQEDPYQTALFQLLGVFAELEASIITQRTKEGLAARMDEDDYHHGPSPIGFEKENGRLIESDNYHQVVSVLDVVAKGDLSKRKAARELGVARATIKRAIEERGELYGL